MAGFDFLSVVDKKIADTANVAERLLDENPKYSLMELREWLELVLKFLEDRHNIRVEAIASDGKGKNEIRIDRLKDFGVDISRSEIAQLHEVRKSSNKAAHAADYPDFFTKDNARQALEHTRRIGEWLKREYQTGQNRLRLKPTKEATIAQVGEPSRSNSGSPAFGIAPTTQTSSSFSRVASRPVATSRSTSVTSLTPTPKSSAVQPAVIFSVLILVALGAIALIRVGDQTKTLPSVPEAPVTVSSVLADFGLRGTFAMDCARRPSQANAYRRFIFEEPLPKFIEDGPSNGYSGNRDTFVVMNAKKLGSTQIALSLGRPPVTIVHKYLVLLVEHDRFRAWSDGFIDRGISEARQQTPWFTRC
jgi:hypothetical protein